MNPRKVWVVATTEFGSVVRTKAFLIGVLAAPIIMVASAGIGQLAAKMTDVRPRAFAVLDRTGRLDAAIEAAARARNDQVAPAGKKASAPTFVPTKVAVSGKTDEQTLLELSDKVRAGELFAFAELPADVLDDAATKPASIRYYSNEPSYMDLEMWLRNVVQGEVRASRLKATGIDAASLARVERPVFAESLGLLSRVSKVDASNGQVGSIKAAEKVDKIRAIAVPAILVVIVYIVVMSSAPLLLTSVIEEKMSKISEVLLGSITPMELMMGKLLGNVGVALALGSIYVGGAYGTAVSYGYGDAVSPALLATLGLFVVMAVFLFGSLFTAVGSACSELKDAQSLMLPVMILAILPMLFLGGLLQNPTSKLAVGLSLFPTSAPYVMLLRMAMTPEPPAWQVALSIGIMALTTLAAVWASSRIFRVGLLMQGKAPSLVQMVKWVWAS